MNTDVLLPKIGFAVHEAVSSQWLVDAGGADVAGQPLYAIESDESVGEIPAPVGGPLKILAAVGETYSVGTVLSQIV